MRKLNASVNEGLASAEARAIIARLGVHSDPGSPEQFAAFITAKRTPWGAAARAIGMKVQ